MAEQRSPIDQVLDLLVYAPLGLAVTAGEEIPRLAEKGRQQLASQVPAARAIGQMAVTQGQRQVEQMARRAAERLAELGLVREPSPSPSGPETSAGSGTPDPAPASTPSPEAEDRPGARPVASGLAIPGYDALSAPQVVQRLEGLSPEELEAVRAYESATRRRKTVLTRIGQIQGS